MGSIDLTLYTNESDPRYLHKDLTKLADVTGDFKDNTDIEKPIILMNWTGTIIGANYLYCVQNQRYYFIDKIVYIRNNLYEIHCSEDYLCSWATRINNLDGVITRAEKPEKVGFTTFWRYPQEVPIECDDETFIESIGNLGNSFAYYVTTNGGVSN